MNVKYQSVSLPIDSYFLASGVLYKQILWKNIAKNSDTKVTKTI